MSNVIELNDVDYIYQKGTIFEQLALQSINFEVGTNECVAVIGHTGSGKSTLLQHLNGLIIPSSGKVLVNGKEIVKKTDWYMLRSQISILFQHAENQLFEKYIGDDVAFGPLQFGLRGDQLLQRVKWALDFVGLSSEQYINRPTYALSGGQKRKAALAGVIAMKPTVLVLDEPTAGLDPFSKNEILSQIKQLQKQEKMSIVFVTHSMEEVAFLADTVYVLDSGKIMFKGTPGELFLHEDIINRHQVALPDSVDLLYQLKNHGLPIDVTRFKENEVREQLLRLL